MLLCIFQSTMDFFKDIEVILDIFQGAVVGQLFQQ